MADTTTRKRADGSKRRKYLSETEITGALAERIRPDGRRRIKLNQNERQAFNRQEMVETAVRLFLDVAGDHPWAEIADQLGISVMALKDLTKTQDFIEVYDQHFAELGHDPRLKSAQAAIVDLLPLAVRELKTLLSDQAVSPSVRFRAIEKVIELNGIGPQKGGQMDRHELMEFLKGANVTLTQNNIQAVAAPYESDINAYVEGRYGEIDAHETSKFAAGVEREVDFPAMESNEE